MQEKKNIERKKKPMFLIKNKIIQKWKKNY